MDRKEVREIDNALCLLGFMRAEDVAEDLEEHQRRVNREASLIAFQDAHGLHVDGICGTQTRKALNRELTRIVKERG
jgi:murein L,D-transpeptidase YcbB/YkuD